VNTRSAASLPALDAAFQTRGQPATAPFAGAGPDQQDAGAVTYRATRGQSGSPAESQPANAGGGHDMSFGAGGADRSGRYSCQIALFSAAGQQRLREASVVLIGLGGLGSLLAQQLACLGVRRYTLLDGETVSHRDLNRVIGATGADVGILKAHVAARLIRAIQPAADVRVAAEPVPLALLGAGAAVGSATVVIAGLDKDEDVMRFILTELCSIAGVPYVDAAAGVSRAGGDVVYGGRVVVAGPAAGCLFCRGELDRRANADQPVDPPERQAGAASRGAGALRGTGASLVTVSGVVASLAATEISCLISGLRPPCGMLTYRAHEGIVTRSGDQPARHCLYCDRWAASRRRRVPDDG
jgi:molybdopterin/thiamine biosynthesis adenylyltransferase